MKLASREAPWKTALTRPTAKSLGETVCSASLRFITEYAAHWLEGASSRVVDTVEGVLGRGCVIPLRGWRKSGPGHAGRLRGRRRKATKSEPRAAMSAGGPQRGASPETVSSQAKASVGLARKLEGLTLGRATRAKAIGRDELSPDGAGWGCLQTTRERQRSALRIGQGSSRCNQPRGVRMQVWLATVERRVSYGSSRSREHGFGRWSRSRGRPRRDRACTGRRRIEAGGR